MNIFCKKNIIFSYYYGIGLDSDDDYASGDENDSDDEIDYGSDKNYIKNIALSLGIDINDRSISEIIKEMNELGRNADGSLRVGGAKADGKGLQKKSHLSRFTQGSKDAKEYMASLRAKKKNHWPL